MGNGAVLAAQTVTTVDNDIDVYRFAEKYAAPDAERLLTETKHYPTLFLAEVTRRDIVTHKIGNVVFVKVNAVQFVAEVSPCLARGNHRNVVFATFAAAYRHYVHFLLRFMFFVIKFYIRICFFVTFYVFAESDKRLHKCRFCHFFTSENYVTGRSGMSFW